MRKNIRRTAGLLTDFPGYGGALKTEAQLAAKAVGEGGRVILYQM